MIKVYNFRCGCGHIFEEFVDASATTCRCECGQEAKRIVSAPTTILDGSTGDFPGAHMKWVREHERRGHNKQEP